MNTGYVYRYNVDENLFKHISIDFDFSCDTKGALNRSIIYILSDMFSDDEKILYVGQTNVDPSNRIKEHLKNLKFSYIYMMQLDTNLRHVVNMIEQEHIRKLNPILQHILVPFEIQNTNGAVTYDHIVSWSIENNKPRRPGRPKTKGECHTINVAVPIPVWRDLNALFDNNKAVKLNITQLVVGLLEKYIEENKQ